MRLTTVFLLIFVLSACQLLPKKANQAQVEEINTRNDSVINTVPLMKPAVQGLHDEALRLFQEGDLERALLNLKRAYKIQAAPQVMMLIGEISLRQGEYSESFYWSKLATENGPSKGLICEKLWRILAISAEMIDETAVQSHALEQKEQCVVRPQNRY